MRVNSLVYLNSKGEIQLHKNVIESLSIFNGSLLFGIYYPRSKSDEKSVNKSDFMFTPIPFSHWQCSSRLIIKLTQQSKSIPKLTEFLSNNGVSIEHSVSNRSAHRYSTWDIHISFDDLAGKELNFLDNLSYYEETYDATTKIVGMIQNEFENELLWSDEKDIDLKQSIKYRVNTALHYFHNITQKRISNAVGKDQKTIYSPFTLRYSKGTIRSNSGHKIGNILSLASNNSSSYRFLPTIGFSESESHCLYLRVRIIERNRLENFYKLSLFYERNGEDLSTTRGLLNLVLNKIPEDFKVWISYNQLYECRPNYGSGRISLFIETPEFYKDKLALMEEIKNLYIRANNDKKPDDLNHVSFWPKISPLYPNYIRKHFKGQREWYKKKKNDVFISYSSLDDKKAEKIKTILENSGLKVFKADREIQGGDLFNEKIREALNNSREVCLLYSKRSAKSQYVVTEWGAAWFMNKLIVTFYLNMEREDALNIDQRLSQTQLNPFEEEYLQDYCNQVLQRRLEYYLKTDEYEYYS
jgi:hypothetical protein